MFAPLFNGMAPMSPPPREEWGVRRPAVPRTNAHFFTADPGVLPPAESVSINRPNLPVPPETVIQPPGAIVVRPRIAVTAAKEPLEPSTLNDEVGQLPSTSMAPLMSVSGDIFANGSPFLAPGVFIPNVHLTPHDTFGVRTTPYAIIPYNIYYDAALQRDFTGIAYLSAGQFGTLAVTTHNNGSMALAAFVSNNFASVGFSSYQLHGYIMQAYNAAIVGWRDYIGVSGQYIYNDSSTGALFIAGGLYARTARRDVYDLGTYKGKSAAAIADAHQIPQGTPLRRVEIRNRTGNTLQLRGGAGTMMIAGMIRLDANTNRDTAYRTFMPPAQASQLVFEGEGPGLFLKNKARALGWAKQPLPTPDHRNPFNIPLGDEVQIVQSGTYTLGVLIGQLAGWATTQAWFRTDLEINIRRTGAMTMEVTITPIKLRSASLYALDPFGPHAASRGTRAMVTRQTLTFDFNEPTALKAYQEVIRGKVPQAVPKRHTLTRHPLTPEEVRQSVQAQHAKLPGGVRRTFAHTLQGSLTDIGAGIKWLFIPTEVLPRGMPLALTTHRQRAHEMQTVTDGETQYNAETYSHLAVTERLNGGRKAVYTAAQQQNHAINGGPSVFDELRLSSTYTESRLRGNNFNRRLVGTLNQRFDAVMDEAQIKHAHEERQMQIARNLDADDLESLTRWAKSQGFAGNVPLSMVSSVRLARIARNTGVSYRKIHKFLADLSDQADPAARALVMQKFVQDHHVKAFATVHHLLDNNFNNVNLSTNSSAYDEPLTKAEALCLKYQAVITATTSSKLIEKRYHEVEKVLRQVQKARVEVMDDPLMSNARSYYLMLLKTSEDRLYQILTMPADRIRRVQRRTTKHHIKRAWHNRVAMAVTPLTTLLDPLHNLQSAWQDRPVPHEPAAFTARFRSLFLMASSIRNHLVYFKNDGLLVAPEERQLRIAALQQAMQTLVGDAPFPKGRLQGLMNVGVLTPVERSALKATLPRFNHDPAVQALRQQIKLYQRKKKAPSKEPTPPVALVPAAPP